MFSCNIFRISIKRFFKYYQSFAISKRCFSDSTIFSLSSGYGKCGVSVIRVSGSNTLQALQELTSMNYVPKPRYATLKTFRHSKTKDVLDKGIVLWFPGPNSFTGEDCCEFQVHGSIAVIEAMLDALANVSGLRLAKPGEFTKRAFFSGKLDLTEVEGLADLIHSETEAQRKQALLQSTGSLSKLYKSWRERIIRCVAHMEAYIDFSEDENIEDNVVDNLKNELKNLLSEMNKHLNDQRQGELLRNGVRTVIIGAPNVGKSSFFNLICQRKVSIVTDIAGTTRDIIESSHNIAGYPVIFSDTAGLRKQTDDIIETEGIQRALERTENSDLIILICDAKHLIEFLKTESDINEFKKMYLSQLGVKKLDLKNQSVILIANKIDLLNKDEYEKINHLSNIIPISCKENLKILEMLDKLKQILQQLCGQPSVEHPRLTHSRYRLHINECVEHLKDFLENHDPFHCPDLAIAAQKLRHAVRCIEQITGEIRSDEILDVIFRDFCIGK